MGPKIEKLGHVTTHDSFWPNFEFFTLELTAIHLLAKFEVSSFNRSRDISGSQDWKIGSRDPHLEFWDPTNISGTVEARNFKFGTETEGGEF